MISISEHTIKTLKFITVVLDARVGTYHTSIIEVLEPTFTSSTLPVGVSLWDWTELATYCDKQEKLIEVIPGYISYAEQQEWIDLLT